MSWIITNKREAYQNSLAITNGTGGAGSSDKPTTTNKSNNEQEANEVSMVSTSMSPLPATINNAEEYEGLGGANTRSRSQSQTAAVGPT